MVYDSYTKGQCTDWVANNASWIQYLGNLGDAYQWLGRAQANGGQVGRTPIPGSVAVWGQNQGGAYGDGHVAVVTQVNQNGSFQVSEMNWSGGPFHSDTRTVRTADVAGFIYPPNSAAQTATLTSGILGSGIGPDVGPQIWGQGGAIQGALGDVTGAVGSAAGNAASSAASALLPDWLKNINWWRVAFTGASILTIGAGLLLFTRQDIAGALGKVAASVR